MGFLCKHCNKTFSNAYNLKRHETYRHSTSKTEYFLCHQCSRQYTHKGNLTRHLGSCKSPLINRSKIISCCLCGERGIPKVDMLQHYSCFHGLDMSIQELNFDSFVEFENWKNKIEIDTVSRYIKCAKQSYPTRTIHSYRCHRDGFFKSTGNNLRQSKHLGSNKINGYCPSKIVVRISLTTGKLSVDFRATHVGHSDDDLRRIPLKKAERDMIATKIQQKVPFDDILKQLRDTSSQGNIERINLLTRKDLYNIEFQYNISDSVRQRNDIGSLKSWMNKSLEKKDTSVIRFYKKQRQSVEGFEDDDFLLVLMNDTQLEVLEEYGNNCLCIDIIQGLNPSNLKLTTVMVLNGTRQGLPCLFAFSNKSDKHIYETIFNILKSSSRKTLLPDIFMSDMDNNESYNAWCEIMGPVRKRLYCSWHVNTAWKNNMIEKVKDSKDQKTLHKILRTLLEEPEKEAFEVMLQASIKNMISNENWKSFGSYFEKNYLQNRTSWAKCYREHTGLDTNIYFEHMHNVLENIYFEGESVKRLDKAINGIMKVVQKNIYKNPNTFQNGKFSSKLDELMRHHEVAYQICMEKGIDDKSILTNEDGTWTIPSSNENEFHVIEVSNPDCSCALICQHCDACWHSYICSCIESAVKWNMCEHIHMVCMYLKMRSSDVAENIAYTTIDQAMEEDNNDMDMIDETKCEDGIILNVPYIDSVTCNAFELKKARVMEKFQSKLNAATTMEDLDIIEKALFSVEPDIETVQSNDPIKDYHLFQHPEEKISQHKLSLPSW